jgi:pimeloyl-ACP methyl ester carboxylesterase
LLEERGHRVIAPVLTGLGEDAERLSPSVDLMTHIDDMTREFTQKNLRDVILVGHSYAGMVISGLADRKRAQLRRLVYLDAFVPEDGQSALDLLPTDIQGMIREMARTLGDGWRIPANEELLDIWGLTPGAARDFVRERFSDFSLRCFEQKIPMARDLTDLPRTYVAAAGDYPGRGAFKGCAEAARQQNWKYHELQTGHQCQAEAPEAVASILLAHGPETKS